MYKRQDERRTTVPISGTRIRENPFAHRRFIDPIVYRDLVTNVAVLGAPSTGKTSLAMALAKQYRTQWMQMCIRDRDQRTEDAHAGAVPLAVGAALFHGVLHRTRCSVLAPEHQACLLYTSLLR